MNIFIDWLEVIMTHRDLYQFVITEIVTGTCNESAQQFDVRNLQNSYYCKYR